MFVVSATKSGVAPETGLKILFCIKNKLNLCVSITGDIYYQKVIDIAKDLLPDISFVSLIAEAICAVPDGKDFKIFTPRKNTLLSLSRSGVGECPRGVVGAEAEEMPKRILHALRSWIC